MLSTNLRLHTPLSSCLFPFIFLSPPGHIISISTSSVLGLKACDPTCWDHLRVSSVSSITQIRSCVAQGSLDLTEICLPQFPESWD